jgi:hypothetical protein
MPGQDAFSVLRFLDGDPAQSVEPARERAGKRFGHVLGDQDAGHVRREWLEELSKRLGTASRCTDDDQLLRRPPGGRPSRQRYGGTIGRRVQIGTDLSPIEWGQWFPTPAA